MTGMLTKINLFEDIPATFPGEWFQTLYGNAHLRIERIVSRGHASPPDFWYDQAWDEWVLLLKGSAGVCFAGDPETIPLGPGDALFIPAHARHRVQWTDPDGETIWLAVHIKKKGDPMDKSTYYEILDSAIQAEIEANHFYQEVSEKVDDAYLKDLFRGLAEEERKHRRILEGFRDREDMAIHFARTPDFHVAETVTVSETLSVEMRPADAIALAMKKEEEAMRHYTQLADACTDPGQQKVFRELAAMEQGHKNKMETAFVDIGYPEVW